MHSRNIDDLRGQPSRDPLNGTVWKDATCAVQASVTFDYNAARRLFRKWNGDPGFKEEVTERIKLLIANNSDKVATADKRVVLLLNIPTDQWLTLQGKRYLSEYADGRQRFNENFVRFLNDRLKQESNFCCWLKGSFNWKRSSTSSEYANKSYWRGHYFCVDDSCRKSYVLQIREVPDLFASHVVVEIESTGKANHPSTTRQKRIVGEERQQQGSEILEKGLSNVQTSSILKNAELGNNGEISDSSDKRLASLNHNFYFLASRQTN